jgi:hypothetical protein
MRTLLAFLLLSGATLWAADEAADRAAIDNVIAALNDAAQRPALFTKSPDSKVDFENLINLHLTNTPGANVAGMNETWQVLTVPKVVSGKIRFITPAVATVEGASTVDGAVTMTRRVPLLFVLKKEGGKWRIDTVRVMAGKAPPKA